MSSSLVVNEGVRVSFRRVKGKKERGATLVEFSMVLPILFLILISIFELGMAFKSYLTVAYLAREGARLSAFSGRDIDADCTTIISLANQMGPQDRARLDRIEIFKADSAGNQSPGTTNTFRFTGTDHNNCTHWTKTINWASTTRQTSVSSTGIPALDVIGVRIVLTHRWISQFPPYSGNLSVNENSIVRMEPEAFS
jgi:Flp pilus assembly protein TadG